jgi:hypothetical protein
MRQGNIRYKEEVPPFSSYALERIFRGCAGAGLARSINTTPLEKKRGVVVLRRTGGLGLTTGHCITPCEQFWKESDQFDWKGAFLKC